MSDDYGTMTAGDLLYAVAKRAGELSMKPIDELRVIAGTQDTPAASIRELRYHKRGELIENILTDEFDGDAAEVNNETQHWQDKADQ